MTFRTSSKNTKSEHNMGDIIRMSDRVEQWKEIFVCDNECSTLRLNVNEREGIVEIYSMDDDGKGIRTILSRAEAEALAISLKRFLPNEKNKTK